MLCFEGAVVAALLSKFPDAVLFDMDGLLIDSERVSAATYRQICARYDAASARDAYPQLIGRDQTEQRAIFKEILPDYVDLAGFDAAWREAFWQALAHEVPLKPDADVLCQWLKGRGVVLMVATSTLTEKAESLLQRAGLLAYFRGVVGGDQVARGKPAPDLYVAAAARAGVVPHDALAFEDTTQGVMAASAAGVAVVQIPDVMPADAESRRAALLVADSLGDAAAHLGWQI